MKVTTQTRLKCIGVGDYDGKPGLEAMFMRPYLGNKGKWKIDAFYASLKDIKKGTPFNFAEINKRLAEDADPKQRSFIKKYFDHKKPVDVDINKIQRDLAASDCSEDGGCAWNITLAAKAFYKDAKGKANTMAFNTSFSYNELNLVASKK
jgi:hypothetical protein